MSNLIQKLIDQGVAINFKNTDFESYDKIFDILTDLDCVWLSGDSPNAIHEQYFERLVDPSQDKFLIISKNYPEDDPFVRISIRKKSRIEEFGLETITANQFFDLANTKPLDYDDVFGQLDESNGSNNLGISETFYIDFSGATDDEIKKIFKILDEHGFLWTSGHEPSSLLDQYITDLNSKHKYRDLLKIYPGIGHNSGKSLLVFTNRHGMVDSRGRYFQPDNVYKAKKFLKQFGIEKLDYDDVFGQLDEARGLSKKLPKTNFSISFEDLNEGDSDIYEQVFRILEMEGYLWRNGQKPTEITYKDFLFASVDTLLHVWAKGGMGRWANNRPKTLTYGSQRSKKVFGAKEFVERFGVPKLDYDDVFGQLDEARGLGKKLPKTNFSISFESLGEGDSHIYEHVFQILEMEGYLWRDGQKPTEEMYKNILFASVRRVLNVSYYETAMKRDKILTYGYPRFKKVFGAKEFVERFGVPKLDYDDVFGQLDESTEDEFNQDGLPKSFTITITDDSPGQIDMVLNVILPFLYDLGYSWRGTRGRGKETPIDFLNVLDEVNNEGFDTSLQINYENEEPMMMSHGGDWHPDWAFTPKEFVKKYMDFDPLDYEDVFKILDN